MEIMKPHKQVTFVSEGDAWRATCGGCGWQSDWAETKLDARDDHAEHITMVLVVHYRKQAQP